MTQYATAEDGIRIAYDVVGEGEPVVLVHGFASNRFQNWRAPGWYDTLTGAGYRVIALDCRGHGESDKPHDPAFYGHTKMADDVIAVMGAASVNNAFLMGYSMGGFISMSLLLKRPDLFRKVVVAGVGATYLERQNGTADPARRAVIADALVAEDKNTISNRTARDFRDFAEQPGKDRFALAACMRGNRDVFTKEQLAQSMRPVLVVCGENDALTGPPGPLAESFADGAAIVVPKRDHMTAVGDKVYKAAALEYFKI